MPPPPIFSNLDGVPLERLLIWQQEMGSDEAIDETPLSFFTVDPSVFKIPAPIPPLPPGSLSHNAPLSSTHRLSPSPSVEACRSFEDIEAMLECLNDFPLKQTATRLVYLDGNPKADILLLGEAPGRDEDLAGKPFVGRAGQLLDAMLNAIGLDRHADDPKKSVLITNTVFWRPPGNRKPSDLECATCLPFVKKTIDLQRPKYIVCLGVTPTQTLLKTTQGILTLRGQWQTFSDRSLNIPVLPTLHPAYLLRQPLQKRLAWRDWLSLHQKILKLNS